MSNGNRKMNKCLVIEKQKAASHGALVKKGGMTDIVTEDEFTRLFKPELYTDKAVRLYYICCLPARCGQGRHGGCGRNRSSLTGNPSSLTFLFSPGKRNRVHPLSPGIRYVQDNLKRIMKKAGIEPNRRTLTVQSFRSTAIAFLRQVLPADTGMKPVMHRNIRMTGYYHKIPIGEPPPGHAGADTALRGKKAATQYKDGKHGLYLV
jgi:hypothetical protein